jgi:hypothetical protein
MDLIDKFLDRLTDGDYGDSALNPTGIAGVVHLSALSPQFAGLDQVKAWSRRHREAPYPD